MDATLIVCVPNVGSSYSGHRVRFRLPPAFHVRAIVLSLGFKIARKCFQMAEYNTHIDRLNVALLE
jgi:hypothetical protein